MEWFKPTDPKLYDHYKAFEELNVVTWKVEVKNIKVGDILYVYSTAPDKRITHKCIVEKVNVPREEEINDEKYVLSSKFDNTYEEGKNYVNLRLLQKLDEEGLELKDLQAHDLRNKQSMHRITPTLSNYLSKIGIRRLFIGNIDKGTEDLNKKHTITAVGKPNWFGDLKVGDWTFISESGSSVDKLLEVERIEKVEDAITYYFKVIRKYDTPRKANEILSSKFFEWNLVILNKALRRSFQEQFFELEIREKYKDIDFSKIDFSREDVRYIYVTQDIARISDKRDGDLYIIVSNEEEEYQINEVLEYEGNENYRKITLEQISDHINIQKCGFKMAYEIAKHNEYNKRRKVKSSILLHIMQGIQKGAYKHTGNLSGFYDILIVGESKEMIQELPTYSIEREKSEQRESNSFTKQKGRDLIVYGVPGSGKSHYIEHVLLKGVNEEENVERVVFYPEYTYYDFIGQKVPTDDKQKGVCLVFEPGSFSQVLAKAFTKPEEHYYCVIEEMNRGNAQAIFGDFFHLIDRDENGQSKYKVNHNDLKEYINKEIQKANMRRSGGDQIELIHKIYLPSNLSIYATINNADQNVFNFDGAFERRWEYKPIFCNKEDDTIYSKGYIKGTNQKWSAFRNAINEKILDNREDIYNAEEKRLGLYYIDEECLSQEVTNDKQDAIKFANKIFRYLYLSVFKNNNQGKIFKEDDKGRIKTLEDYIADFVQNEDRKLEDIFKI